MKIRYILMILCVCICSVIFTSCNNNSNLMEMTYDASSTNIMILGGEKYYFVGSAPNTFKRDKKIAMVKPEKNVPKSYSKTSSDFKGDKELSQIQNDGKTVSIYKIQGRPESEWIAVKDKEVYKLHWIRGTSLPREYFDMWRIYGR